MFLFVFNIFAIIKFVFIKKNLKRKEQYFNKKWQITVLIVYFTCQKRV